MRAGLEYQEKLVTICHRLDKKNSSTYILTQFTWFYTDTYKNSCQNYTQKDHILLVTLKTAKLELRILIEITWENVF